MTLRDSTDKSGYLCRRSKKTKEVPFEGSKREVLGNLHETGHLLSPEVAESFLSILYHRVTSTINTLAVDDTLDGHCPSGLVVLLGVGVRSVRPSEVLGSPQVRFRSKGTTTEYPR